MPRGERKLDDISKERIETVFEIREMGLNHVAGKEML